MFAHPRVLRPYRPLLVGGGQAVSILSPLSVLSLLAKELLTGVPIASSHGMARSIDIQTMTGRKLPDAAHHFIDHLVRELD
ncbi:hypothetical protein [Ancylobacter oerskovii]|uniref:LysR substrate binding domain-containing protein n=1 Tax=Ancylobacter oerskovii TaxID=459519 RepID=A0ABW4YW35_9HYPH|nr:hypothetical protein [Ancylobacter oerskovii]MBS7542421.1 hypothetical protein [Ancylobacter oerskovii]